MKREFFLQDDRSNKFWTVEVDDARLITTNGRVGAKPRETVKTYVSNAAAMAECEKQIAAKQNKGYQEGAPPEYESPDWASIEMSEDTFWRIIGLFDWSKTGDDDAVMAAARRALASMDEARIDSFDELLAQRLHALDTEAHAREIGEEAWDGEYVSADWFLYVRCAAVANGREIYESALRDPARMVKDVEFESLLYLPSAAWSVATAADSMDYPHQSSVSVETFANKAGWGAVAPDLSKPPGNHPNHPDWPPS